MMNGILNIYKEAGYTSFDVVAKLRGILHEKKIGHTGTLDPDATGVLPVCIGNATKVCALLTDKDKEYEAVLQLGLTSDTQDATGQIVKDRTDLLSTLSEERVRTVIMGFVGAYEQIPPMYSALKVGGKKLCDLAREGIEVERKARLVHLYDIEIVCMELPYVTMRVRCSKGTYIRTLCHDIGEMLGVGGLMKSLVRMRVSSFALDDAVTLEKVEEYRDNGRLGDILMPVDVVFGEYPALNVSAQARKLLLNGNRLTLNDISDELDGFSFEADTRFRIYDGEKFCAIYGWDDSRRDMKCVKMFL